MAISKERTRKEIKDKMTRYAIINDICTHCFSRYTTGGFLQCAYCLKQKRGYRKRNRDRIREFAREYTKRPEVRTRMRDYQREYINRPGIREKYKLYQREWYAKYGKKKGNSEI